MENVEYTVDRIKELCSMTKEIRTDLFSQTYRINYGSEAEPNVKDIQVFSIPLQKQTEDRLFSRIGVSSKQHSQFYNNFATALKKDASKYKIITQSDQSEAFRDYVLVFDTIQRERLSNTEMKFYYVSKVTNRLTDSSFIENESIHLSAVFKIWKNLLETIDLISGVDLHLGTIELDDIFVDENDNPLVSLPVKVCFTGDTFKKLLPANVHTSILEGGVFTKDTDFYAVNSLIYSLLNGSLTPITYAPNVKPGYLEDRLSSLFSIADTKDVIASLNSEIAALADSPDKDIVIPLDSENDSDDIEEKLSAIPLTVAVNAPQGQESEQTPSSLPSEPLQAGVSSDTETDGESDQESKPEEEQKEKKSPLSKFASKLPGKKKGKEEESDEESANIPPEGQPLKQVISRKGGNDKKSKLDVLKNKKIVMLALAGILLLVFAFTQLMPSTDPTEGMTSATDDNESTFVVADQNDSSEGSHYSAIEKEDDSENDTTPSSSTYSEDDEDTSSDEDETDEDTEEDEDTSSTSSSSSSGSSSGSSSSSSFNGSGSSSSTSNRSSSSSGSSSGTSTYRPTASSSNTSNSSSSSSARKPTTSTAASTTQTTSEPEKPVVKPVSTLTVSPNSLDMRVGDSVAITPTMTCSFLSDSASVAVVDGGKVVAKGAGSCTITAKGIDGQTYNISVNVSG